MRFVDPDGMQADDWVRGKNKIYDTSLNGGKGGYTKHATATDREFGDGLRNSGAEGAAQFKYMVSADTHDITVNFQTTDASSEGVGYLFGLTKNEYNTDSNGKVTEILSSEINIFMGTADTFVADVKNSTLKVPVTDSGTKADIDAVKAGTLDAKGQVIATFGHEIAHTTRTNQQQSNDQAKNPSGPADGEHVPTQVERQIKKDLIKK